MSLGSLRSLKKYYGLLTLICVITGFIFPQFSILSPYIPFLLAILVFSMVIEHRTSDFTGVVKHPEIVMALIISNLILYPFIGILMGHWLHLKPDIMIGLVLLCFAPSPVIAALWTELSGGDGTISISTALFSKMLSVIVYPVILFFMGITSHDLSISIFRLLVLSIFAPAVIALFLRLKNEKHIPARNTITFLSSFIGLLIIVVAIAYMASKIFINDAYTLIIIVLIVTTLLSAGFIYGYFLKRFFRAQKDYEIGFLYTSSMRDGIIPLSIGITYFGSYSTIPAAVLLIVMPFMVVGIYYLVRK